MTQFEVVRRYTHNDFAVIHKPTKTTVITGDSVTAGWVLGYMMVAEHLIESVENMPIATVDKQEMDDD